MTAQQPVRYPSGGLAPQANLFDIPEMMPGAMPSANPAQRTEFEQRCRQLHHETELEKELESSSRTAMAISSGVSTTTDELALMFPTLDPELVRVLAADAPTPQHAMETLLALVAASSEPAVPPLPPKDLPLSDINLFPSLTDSDGWQVVSQSQLERDPDEDLGNAWRDRAKAVASKPAPPSSRAAPAVTPKRRAAKKEESHDIEVAYPETDYESRRRRGLQRAKNRAQFGRGGKGFGKSGRGGSREDDVDESEEEEEEEEEVGAQT